MELRLIKDETEIAAIKKACSISDQAFRDILDYIQGRENDRVGSSDFPRF